MLVCLAAFCGAAKTQSDDVVVIVPKGVETAFVNSPRGDLRWGSVRSGQRVRLAADESLDIEIWKATPGKIAALQELVRLRKLNSLNLRQSQITAEIWAELAALDGLPELRLGGGFLPSTMDDCGALERLRGLQRLRFSDETLLASALIAAKDLPHLAELDILGKALVRKDVREALAQLRHVRAIDLGVLHEVSDADLACLAQLPALARLECWICRRDPCQGAFLSVLAGKLRELVVVAEPADGAAFAKVIAPLTSLERLEIKLGDKTSWDDSLSVAIGGLPALRSLSIKGVRGLTAEGLAALAKRGILTELNCFCDKGVSDSGASAIARIGSLKDLSLRATGLGSEGLSAIAELDLRSLNLYGPIGADSRAIRSLARMKSLETLRLGGPGLDDEAAAAIAKLSNLHTLFICSDHLTSAGGQSLAALSKLRHLDCGRCPKIGDRALAAWAALPLCRLDLSETGITDRGVATLAGLKDLRRLDLSQSHVTDKGVAALGSLPRLEYLALNRCPGVTSRIGRTAASMPSLLFITAQDCLAMNDVELEKSLAEANARPFTSSTEVANQEDVRLPDEKGPSIPPPPKPAD